jgi:hypothetical protein
MNMVSCLYCKSLRQYYTNTDNFADIDLGTEEFATEIQERKYYEGLMFEKLG